MDEKLALAIKVAQNTIGYSIPPLRPEDCGKELHKILNNMLDKIYHGKVSASLHTDAANGDLVCTFTHHKDKDQ